MRRGPSRLRFWLALCVLPVLAITLSGCDAGIQTGGPLSRYPAYGYSIVVPVGGRFVDADNVLRDYGHMHPSGQNRSRIVSIEAVYSSSALRTTKVWVALPTRATTSAPIQQFYRATVPDDRSLGRLVGPSDAPLLTNQAAPLGTQVLVGTQVTRPGHFYRKGLLVTYWADGREYRDLVKTQVTVCTPRFARGGRCAFLGDGA